MQKKLYKMKMLQLNCIRTFSLTFYFSSGCIVSKFISDLKLQVLLHIEIVFLIWNVFNDVAPMIY